MSDFLLRVGIDASGIKNPMAETVDTLNKVENKAKETGKGITDAFNAAGNVAEKVDQKLKPLNKNLEALKNLGRQAGKELADAFKTGNVDLLEKKVVEFQKKLSGINAKVGIDIDDAALDQFEKQLQSADNAVGQLAASVDFAKTILNSLDPNSEEFQQLSQNIDVAEAAITEFSNQVNQNIKKQKSLKTELKETKEQMALLALNGKQGTKAFAELEKRGGELKDQLKDINDRLNAAGSDTKYFDGLINGATGLVGAFTAVQGATALWGGENEELEKTLIKVNGAMAILQGLQATAEVLNKDSAFSTVFLSKAKQADTAATQAQTGATVLQTVAMNGASVAAKLLRVALVSIGIGAIIAVVAYLVANWDKLKKSMDDMLPTGSKVGDIFNDIKIIASGVGSVIVNGVISPIRSIISLVNGDLDGAIQNAKNAMDVVGAFEKGAADMSKKIRTDAALDAKKQRLDDWKSKIDIMKAEGKDTYETESKYYKNRVALVKKEGGDVKAAVQEAAEFEARRRGEMRKEAQDAAKRAADEAQRQREEAQRKAEEAARKAAEAKKKQDDLLIKYTEEISNMQIQKMDEGFAKERAAIETEAKNKINALKQDGANRADVLEKQKELEQAITDAANQKIKELEKKQADEVAKLKVEGSKMVLEFSKESAENSLKLAQIEHEQRIVDIEEKFKTETKLKDDLLKTEAEYFSRVKKQIKREAREKEISEAEQLAITGVEIASFYAEKSAETEEQKQIAILEIQQEYAEKRLANLMKNGGTNLEISNAILAVQQTEEALAEYSKKGKKFDIFKFLGIGEGLTGEQKAKILENAAQMGEQLSEIADFIVEQYQRQIDKKQEVIDQYNNDIENLEGQLEKEKELRDEGLANNVDALEKELEAKKAARDEEIRQQKELQERQARIQKAQMVAETAVQLVGMITSTVNVFKSATEQMGVWGVPVAIAMTAVMLGAFAAAKVKAFQAIKEGSKFKHGGEIGFGGSHEEGGSKFYAADGSGIEAEKGEFITKKDSYRKYKKFVQAFNDDDFSELTWRDFEAVGLFEKLGLTFQNENIYDAVKEMKDNSDAFSGFSAVGSTNISLGKMDENLQYLADSQREKIEVYEDAEYYYKKIGTRITRTRKKV